ncbi:hypothetical protein COOONC_08293 [Cooperia oncophora]
MAEHNYGDLTKTVHFEEEIVHRASKENITAKNENLSSVLVFLFYVATTTVLVMLIGFWILLMRIYPMTYVMPLIIVTLAGYLLLFGNLGVACL